MPSIRTLIAIVFIPVSVVAALALSDRGDYRFKAGYGSCVMRDVYQSRDRHYDLVVIGGSRMGSLMQEKYFRRHFKKTYGKNLKILRLVIPIYDIGLGYSMLRATLKNHRVRHVLVMMQGYSAGLKQAEGYRMWRLSEFWQVFKLDGARGLQGAAQLNRYLLQRIRDLVFLRRQSCEEHVAFVQENRKKRQPDAKEIAARQARLGDMRDVVRGQEEFGLAVFDINAPGNEYLKHFSAALVRLARSNGAEITFLRIAGIADRQWGAGWLRQFQMVTGAPLIQFPESMRWQLLDSLSFSDRAHLSRAGARTMLPWLAEELTGRGL